MFEKDQNTILFNKKPVFYAYIRLSQDLKSPLGLVPRRRRLKVGGKGVKGTNYLS